MSIFKWIDNWFGKASFEEFKNSEAEAFSAQLQAKSVELFYLRTNIYNITDAICNDYKRIHQEIQTARANDVPIEELQINLGEREAIGRILKMLQGHEDTSVIISNAFYEVNSTAMDVKTVDNHQYTRQEILAWIINEIMIIIGCSEEDLDTNLNEIEKLDLSDDLGLDSLDLVELLMAAESNYGIDIANEAAVTVKTVEQAIDLIIIATAIERG